MGNCMAKEKRKTDLSYCELRRSLTNGTVDSSIPFPKQIQQAIKIRNKNIEQIKQFIQTHSLSTKDTKKCLKLCDEEMKSHVTMAVVGRLNSGKSMLVSALLEWEIVLPSSDEATTGRITRFVYSHTPIIKRIKTGYWLSSGQCEEYEESVLSEDALNEDMLSDYIQLSQEDRHDVESLSTIIEIGIPSKLLKSGLKIIDCPGLDENQLMSDIELQILSEINPSIVCHVYDYREGFSLKDGERLEKLITTLYLMRGVFDFLIVANKYDSGDENEIDTEQVEIQFDENHANATVRQNCSWKHRLISPYIDKDRLLPVVPLSCEFLIRDCEEDNKEKSIYKTMLKNLQNQITLKIISGSRFVSSWIALRGVCESNLNLYFLLESLSVEDDLIELMSRNCDDRNLLVDFSGAYKVFGLKYRGDEIHVTTLSSANNNQIDYQQERKRIHLYKLKSGIIYENADNTMIYLIEKERSHIRLMDHLNEYSLNQMIKGFSWCFHKDSCNFLYICNFRPDNVYADKNGSNYMNLSVPHHPNLPFVFKRSKSN